MSEDLKSALQRRLRGWRPGDRVACWLSADDREVRLLGYGVYDGEDVPGPEAGGLAALLRSLGEKNPRLRLDDGTVVWGGECWWGDEERMKLEVGSRRLVPASVAEAREAERAARQGAPDGD